MSTPAPRTKPPLLCWPSGSLIRASQRRCSPAAAERGCSSGKPAGLRLLRRQAQPDMHRPSSASWIEIQERSGSLVWSHFLPENRCPLFRKMPLANRPWPRPLPPRPATAPAAASSPASPPGPRRARPPRLRRRGHLPRDAGLMHRVADRRTPADATSRDRAPPPRGDSRRSAAAEAICGTLRGVSCTQSGTCFWRLG